MCFFFNDTATTEIYTLSLHDALPISGIDVEPGRGQAQPQVDRPAAELGRGRQLGGAGQRLLAQVYGRGPAEERSEEHTSELQSRQYLVCRLLLEKKKPQQPILLVHSL